MSNEKFTQSDWSVDGETAFDIQSENGTVVHWLGFDDTDFNHNQNKANANLIAMAPKMYRMLKGVSSLRDLDAGSAIDWLLDNTDEINSLLSEARGE